MGAAGPTAREKIEAWSRKQRQLDISLQPRQWDLLDAMAKSPATWIGYGGSRGGAKSGAGRRAMLIRRLGIAGSAGMIFRRTYPDLVDNHIEPMFRDYPALRKLYHVGDKAIRFPNGSTLVFRYGENHAAIQSFLGKEYMDVFIDQAEALSERELVEMRTVCRWTGVDGAKCNYVLAFNPGGRGTQFLKRIFHDRKYKPGERDADYVYIQSRGWDNIEWSRNWLRDNNVTDKTYYQVWGEDQRKACFLENSEYGRAMGALPPSLRAAWLHGDFESFAGQYFQSLDDGRNVRKFSQLGIDPWHERWIGMDWGYAHNSAVLWAAKTPSHVAVYRELVLNRCDEATLARRICEMSEGEKIGAVYISPDTAAKRGSAKPTIEQIGDLLRAGGLPWPTPAANTRVAGWRMIDRMLGSEDRQPTLYISDACPRLLESLKLMSRDPTGDKPEDCEKFDCAEDGTGGDDAPDALRYLLLSYFGDREMPAEEHQRRAVQAVEERLEGRPAQEIETARVMTGLGFMHRWRQRRGPGHAGGRLHGRGQPSRTRPLTPRR